MKHITQYVSESPMHPLAPEGETTLWATTANGTVKSVAYNEQGHQVTTWDHSQNRWQLLLDEEGLDA